MEEKIQTEQIGSRHSAFAAKYRVNKNTPKIEAKGPTQVEKIMRGRHYTKLDNMVDGNKDIGIEPGE